MRQVSVSAYIAAASAKEREMLRNYELPAKEAALVLQLAELINLKAESEVESLRLELEFIRDRLAVIETAIKNMPTVDK